MNIYEKLLKIQTELKAPKNQYNSFGKYHYRSCEDILEGLKPLLEKHKVTLIISDDIKQVGDRYYIKTTVELIDVESDPIQILISTAYAREDETKKGMDLAQVTGSASSYARKYALNGLFAIDDTKDSDSTNTHGKGQQDPIPPKAAPPKQEPTEPMITKEQQNEIFKLAEEKNYTPESMTNYLKNAYNKPTSKELTYKEADELIKLFKGNKGE